MTFFISGGAKNGKSALAQDLTMTLANGGKHYYVATMISTGAEDDERIRRHIADRDGMGFETVECFTDIMTCLETADREGAFLVDSLLTISDQVIFYFLIAALAVLILTLVFTSIFTRPIATLTEGIRRMGRGDLSTRVKVTGINA